MKKRAITISIFTFILTIMLLVRGTKNYSVLVETGAPPYMEEDLQPPSTGLNWLENWERPEGPPKVGLQVGHWKNNELPEELDRLKGNTGSSGGGKKEWEVNFDIANKTSKLLSEHGVKAEILPSTIPAGYYADVFVAIHADGSDDSNSSGYKLAHPRRDYSGKASMLLDNIDQEYGSITQLPKDPNVTRNMTGYYAFAWWRYDHAVHPMTPSVILETGFLTSPEDRKIIVENSSLSAEALARGILEFLESQNYLEFQSN